MTQLFLHTTPSSLSLMTDNYQLVIITHASTTTIQTLHEQQTHQRNDTTFATYEPKFVQFDANFANR